MTGTNADTQWKFSSRYVVLPTENVDTDQIIPARFLTTTSRAGLGPNAFNDWRYLADGSPNPDFVLNKPESQGAEVLVAGHNFGCGSSREHAPWALQQYGFRALIAPSYADIFFNNCFKNGLLPIQLPEPEVNALFHEVAAFPGYAVTIDLERQVVIKPDDKAIAFDVESFRKYCLLGGYDDVALTLRHADKIRAFEAERLMTKPWLDQRV